MFNILLTSKYQFPTLISPVLGLHISWYYFFEGIKTGRFLYRFVEAISMCSTFISYILTLFILWWKFTICQGQLQTSIRITNAINCNLTGLKWLVYNASAHYSNPKTYIEAHFRITEDINRLNRLYIHLERCNDRGYDCEDFQNYRIDRICQMLLVKNQVWSKYITRFHPPLRCPIKKAIYEVRNATMNIENLMNWFPDTTKYLWKSTFKLTNEQDKVVLCATFDAQMYQFRLQDGNPSRDPRLSKK